MKRHRNITKTDLIITQLPHKMLSNRLGDFAMDIDVLSKITSTTILQHKKDPISSLHTKPRSISTQKFKLL